ncbi:MAG: class I SAM-dependent rRNA methyltransferase [Polyangiaceae bacterium]
MELRATAITEVKRGHPWVWKSSIASASLARFEALAAGADVELVGPDGSVVGGAVADPLSPIAARVWSADGSPVDDVLIRDRVARAIALRRDLTKTDTTAYRLVHGEGDRAPGIVVDRYGPVAVLRLDGDAARARRDQIARAISPLLREIGVVTLLARDRQEDPVVIFGELPREPVVVREHGAPFVADVVRGQKTGAFLDQRENRRRVGAMARDKTVLNLFSYAGGFSLHAALGGATRVTSVDSASAAHATAQSSFRAAGVDPKQHDFITADAFAFLVEAKKKNKTWDIVVSDPPSFAHNEKSMVRALSGYRTLHRACAAVLAPGGIFCAASCSSHVDAKTFVSTLDDAALDRHDLRLIALHGPPEDHPTIAAFPEGHYLKFAVLT